MYGPTSSSRYDAVDLVGPGVRRDQGPGLDRTITQPRQPRPQPMARQTTFHRKRIGDQVPGAVPRARARSEQALAAFAQQRPGFGRGAIQAAPTDAARALSQPRRFMREELCVPLAARYQAAPERRGVRLSRRSPRDPRRNPQTG